MPRMTALNWRFETTFASLPEAFYAHVSPRALPSPALVIFNAALARELGLAEAQVAPEALAKACVGLDLPANTVTLAQAYAGHQFGHFAMLGDGRALLLGEHLTPAGRRVDIHLKGSGPTPFARRGDGLAALGPMLREYVISEAMHALGVPTSRSLSVVRTGERVWRERANEGAILTRVAASHLRVGMMEYAAARDEGQHLLRLVDYAIGRHYPDCAHAKRPALALLEAVVAAQAELIAQWMSVGFIHGVMNTDNMALSGETIDYGPCAFMDVYDPATVFSSIDTQGRYAYGNQPAIAQWNLARLAEALLPAIDPDEDEALTLARAALEGFGQRYREAYLRRMRAKLGLTTPDGEDVALIEDLLAWMQTHQADYTQTLRQLARGGLPEAQRQADAALAQWHDRWQARLAAQGENLEATLTAMRTVNPVYIPRNHLVEAALAAATGPEADLSVLERLLAVLQNPYEERAGLEAYAEPDPQGGVGYRTFCGT